MAAQPVSGSYQQQQQQPASMAYQTAGSPGFASQAAPSANPVASPSAYPATTTPSVPPSNQGYSQCSTAQGYPQGYGMPYGYPPGAAGGYPGAQGAYMSPYPQSTAGASGPVRYPGGYPAYGHYRAPQAPMSGQQAAAYGAYEQQGYPPGAYSQGQ